MVSYLQSTLNTKEDQILTDDPYKKVFLKTTTKIMS